MEHIVRQIHKLLIKKGKTLALAESCTGGLLSALLTELSGSSQYFLLGIVAYSNQGKQDILKIPSGLINRKGAVSQEVAVRLARNARKAAHSDFGIGITGIAGPSGATPQKPVGTVFIAVEGKEKRVCKKFLFSGNRTQIRKKASLKALNLLKTLV
jgi:nicotinamide-nucleotide amidase